MTTKKEVHETPAAELVAQVKDDVKLDAAKEVAKDTVKAEIKASTGTESDVEDTGSRFLDIDGPQLLAPMLELGVEAFEKAVSEKADYTLSEAKIAGLYKLERNGQNRTPYVKAMRDRLGLKKGEDVPGAGGPAYTNDVTLMSDL